MSLYLDIHALIYRVQPSLLLGSVLKFVEAMVLTDNFSELRLITSSNPLIKCKHFECSQPEKVRRTDAFFFSAYLGPQSSEVL
jgi:hypothetical protein